MASQPQTKQIDSELQESPASIVSTGGDSGYESVLEKPATSLGGLNDAANKQETVGSSDGAAGGKKSYISDLEKRLADLEAELKKKEDTKRNSSGISIASPQQEERESPREIGVRWVPSRQWRDVKKGMGYNKEDPALIVSFTTPSGQFISLDGHDNAQGIAGITLGAAVSEAAHTSTGANKLNEQTTSTKIPERVFINSAILSNTLSEVTTRKYNNVLMQPFKALLVDHAKIRKARDEFREQLNAKKDDCESAEGGLEQKTSSGLKGTSASEDEMSEDKKLRDLETKRDLLTCLIEFIDDALKPIFDLRKSIDNETIKDIAYGDLWHLFKPGDLVVSNNTNSSKPLRAYQVLHVTGGRRIVDESYMYEKDAAKRMATWEAEEGKGVMTGGWTRMTPFVLDCFHLDYDGSRYGPKSKRIFISEYSGVRTISKLEVYPLRFASDPNKIRQTLISRGKTFVSLTPTAHKLYKGLTTTGDDKRSNEYREEVNSEVVLDQDAGIDHFSKNDLDFAMELSRGIIMHPTELDKREIGEWVYCGIPGCRSCTDVFDDSVIDEEARSDFMHETNLLTYAGAAGLTSDHLLLLTPRMYGYALQERKWYALNVECTADLEANRMNLKSSGTAFEYLVLPKEHKMLIQALVKQQTRRFQYAAGIGADAVRPSGPEEISMDLVRGKGKGLIILLHGVPGVGKTSTAECVAAQLNRPLFPITCGDLGVDVQLVEKRLEEYFKLAQRWGCVLLLDEADVFLAKRSSDQLKRNGLVSVFLRVLEYYAGVLILTTNRVGEFDEAFRSRIHVSLYYEKLNKETTAKIWEMNLKRIKEAEDLEMDVDEPGIREFYQKHWAETEEWESRRWNGRQIKNAFQTAIALANWECYDTVKGKQKYTRPHLRDKHFEHVVKTSNHFDDYLLEVLGGQEGADLNSHAYSHWARRNDLRDDRVPGIAYGIPTERRPSQGPRRQEPKPHRPEPTPLKMKASSNPEPPEVRAKRLELELLQAELAAAQSLRSSVTVSTETAADTDDEDLFA